MKNCTEEKKESEVNDNLKKNQDGFVFLDPLNYFIGIIDVIKSFLSK